MFKINDAVVHPSAGIWKILDIRSEYFGVKNEKYYILLPLYSSATTKTYIPILGNKITLCSPIPKEELEFTLKNSLHLYQQWIDNDKTIIEKFNAILRNKKFF